MEIRRLQKRVSACVSYVRRPAKVHFSGEKWESNFRLNISRISVHRNLSGAGISDQIA